MMILQVDAKNGEGDKGAYLHKLLVLKWRTSKRQNKRYILLQRSYVFDCNFNIHKRFCHSNQAKENNTLIVLEK